MVTTLATPEPLIVPISAEETTADLRRAAALVADGAHGDVGEQADHPGALQEGAEQDEQEDVGGGDVGRRAVDAVGAEVERVDELAELVAAVIERRGQVFAEEPVGEERGADDRQRPSHHHPSGEEHQPHGEHADNDVPAVRIAGAEQDVGVEVPVIEADDEAEHAEPPEQDRLALFLRGAVGDQPEQEQEQEADMHRADDLARQRRVGRRPDLEGGEGDGDEEQDPRRTAGAPAIFLRLAWQIRAVGRLMRHVDGSSAR